MFEKGLPKIMGQKSSSGEPRTRKSVRYFIFPQDLNSLTIPSAVMVSLLASLIVTSMSSISEGAMSLLPLELALVFPLKRKG